MSIRSKIACFQIFFVCALLGMVAVFFVAMDRSHYYQQRVIWTYKQLEALSATALYAMRYSEQIPEMLLLGEEVRADFEEARHDLEQGFDTLEALVRQEIAFIDNEEGKAEEAEDLVAINRMRELFFEVNRAANELFRMAAEGRREEAVVLFRDQAEDRMDVDLRGLIAGAVAAEQLDIDSKRRAATEFIRKLIIVVGSATAFAVVVSIVAVALLNRAFSQPITRLMQGADAIGRGDLGYRIERGGKDELALLSQRFDAMAAQLGAQQAALLGARSTLEGTVRQRTAELESANHQLKQLDHARVMFLADISHEMRTPLTVLRGEAEVTLRNRSTSLEDCRATLKRIVDRAKEMSRMVDDLLFITRAETDTLRFDRRRVDLREVLCEAYLEGGILAREKNVTVACELPEAPIFVAADPERLTQAVMIAVDNAVKYSDSGAEVRLSLAAADGHAMINVRDHGIGIPPEEQAHVFERFYRGRDPRSRASAGSGLGLPIAKWIVDKHRGEISIDSVPRGATTVTIRLARAE